MSMIEQPLATTSQVRVLVDEANRTLVLENALGMRVTVDAENLHLVNGGPGTHLMINHAAARHVQQLIALAEDEWEARFGHLAAA